MRSVIRPHRTGRSTATNDTTARPRVAATRTLNNANGDLIQLAAWYDNEWGYSCRLADLTAKVLEKIPANA